MTYAHISISGTVHGVGFRQFIRSKAKQAGITGWVRNCSNGTVEAVLQGDKKNIEELIAACRQGTFLSDVKNIVVEWDPLIKPGAENQYNEFQIVHE